MLNSQAQQIIVSGKVSDDSSGETLIGAYIYSNTNSGIVTNSKGFFSLAAERGKLELQVSYVGYETKSVLLNLEHDTIINIKLLAGIKLGEVQIESFKTESDFLKGRLTIPMIKLKEMPALGGEADMIKALSTLSGIAPVNEGSSGIIVRGGSSDQNLFILDGIPVYNTGHLFNFISVFNPDAVKRIDFYKGSFPARYGGRLSSVTDITFRDGNQKEIKGNFDVGLINSKLTLEGPLSQKTTFLIAARSTYLDLFTPIRKARIANKKKFKSYHEMIDDEMILYTFADLNLKLNHRFNNKNSVAFNLYSGTDYYRLNGNYDLQTEKEKYLLVNNVASLKTNHVINPKLFISSVFGISTNSGRSTREFLQYHRYTVVDTVKKRIFDRTDFEREDKSRQVSSVSDISGALDFSFFPAKSNTLNFGFLGMKHLYQPGHYTNSIRDTINNINPFDSQFDNDKYSTTELSFYLDDEITIKEKLHINGGLRFSSYHSPQRTFSNFEPRLSVSLASSKAGSFIGSYARMTQSSHALLKNDLLMYKTLWVPSFNWLPPEKSDLFSIGYINKNEKKYSFEIEAFYKKMYNLVEYNINYNSTYSYYKWENSVLSGGLGRAYGLEVTGEKATGIFTGNINYTLSWIERKFDDLNEGNWYPYIYDRRHVVNLSGAVKINQSWKASFFWTLSSGHRINFPNAYINYNPYTYGYFVYDGVNTRRLPAYHRLDLSAEWHKKRANGEPYGLRFSVYNAYCKLNAYYLYIDKTNVLDEKGNVTGTTIASVKKKTLLPLLPSINFFYNF